MITEKQSHFAELNRKRFEMEAECDKVNFKTEIGDSYYPPDGVLSIGNPVVDVDDSPQGYYEMNGVHVYQGD